MLRTLRGGKLWGQCVPFTSLTVRRIPFEKSRQNTQSVQQIGPPTLHILCLASPPLRKEIMLNIAIILGGKNLHLLLQLPLICILVNLFFRIASAPAA